MRGNEPKAPPAILLTGGHAGFDPRSMWEIQVG
jgi:hypothetical protein